MLLHPRVEFGFRSFIINSMLHALAYGAILNARGYSDIQVNDLRNLFNECSIAGRKFFIKSFEKEIIVTGKYIPMQKDGLPEENLEVPHIVHYGGAEVSIGSTGKDFDLVFSFSF